MNRIALLLVGIVFIGISFVDGHSYVTSPTSRSNQKQTTTGCRGPNCLGPCDASASRARTPIVVQRGASLNIQWPRNNHAGGFIRLAWAPTSQSDTHSVFDNNVQEFVCHERGGCKPDSASDPNGGDSGPADGSRNPCQVSITVPPHLTDGLWTLQWAWFGGAFELGDYYSCIDYQISGGASGSRPAPFFLGGDYTYPGQNKCKFFNTDRLHQCVNEPCNNPVFPSAREQSGPAYGVTATGSSSTTTTGTTAPRASTTTTGSTTAPRTSTTTTTTGARTSTSTTTGTRTSSTTTTTGTHAGPSGNMCYLPGTPNLGGKVSGSGTCGRRAPRNRCAEGECCSQWGYCGKSSLYCDNNSADYRKVPCDSIVSGISAVQFTKQEGSGSTIMNVMQLRWIVLLGIFFGLLPLRWN